MRGSLVINRRLMQRVRQLGSATFVLVKIKFLIWACLAFSLVALVGRTSELMGWTKHRESVHYYSAPWNRYTVLINTWKRYDLLKRSISHYSSCIGLDSIHIVWSEAELPSDSLVKFLNDAVESNSRNAAFQVELEFDMNTEDSLNNRFKEIKELRTNAVFSIDDDVILPCSSVQFAFNVWKSAEDTMVGFVPRAHWFHNSHGEKEHYSYGGWWSVWWTGSYSMVLSKAAFFHKKYLNLYTNSMPAPIREYITENRNCEDIAMSFLISNATGAPPIWVKGKIHEIGSMGISSLGGHSEKRTQCLNKFVDEFGRMPLVSTSIKAVDTRDTLFW